ncbi:phage shock protein C (PspC) family protein [Roseivirga pacifica]|uniref:Phage shock protein C (PspC) family protein n=1 Tax=Roseivirga pacifica TaxID=1267423 RepID=A0A1I0RPJ0_9BACT|nr:PspC domain-containing protein [Roseivirga pacifica]RKQ49993.1 phage shock protein C (PspC) family protein [Roseivirga pacifica]SEW43196.1 phage shock protein C (PspC) family protein [Roseivirga pacifica]
MKKNISINISGIIFHIEEDGYDTLKKYLDSINKYFATYEDSEEIVADIEGRIAELFLEKLQDDKQVISFEDIKELMETMGEVSDFEAMEMDEAFASNIGTEEKEAPKGQNQQKRQSYSSNSANSNSKKLERDTKRQLIGGVSAGLAHYFNTDPIWIRGLFILATATGLSIIAYIILWIALPGNDDLPEDESVRKLYRDPDDRVLGGVAAGLGNYFRTKPLVFRIILLLLFFGYGTGLLFYIVLWIIMPKANSLTDRMQMKGQKVTLSNIDSNIKKNKEEELNPKGENTFTKILLFPFRLIGRIFSGIGRALAPLMLFLVGVIRVFTGAIVSIVGLSVMISLIATAGVLLGFYNSDFLLIDSDLTYFPHEVFQNTLPGIGVVFILASVFIPFLYIFLAGLTIIAKRRVMSTAFGWSLLGFWFISILGSFAVVPNVVRGFRDEGVFRESESLTISADTLHIGVNNTKYVEYDDRRDRVIYRDDHNSWYSEFTDLDLRPSEDGQYSIEKRFWSRGRNVRDAERNAEDVDYSYQLNGNTINFDSEITFPRGTKFYFQEVDVDFYIPINQPFTIDRDARWIMSNFNRRLSWYQISRNVWMFNEDKELICISCENEEKTSERIDNESKSATTDAFNSIRVRRGMQVTLVESDEHKVTFEGPEFMLNDVKWNSENDELTVDIEDNYSQDWSRVKVTIEAPVIDHITLSNGAELNYNADNADLLILNASGNSRANLRGEIGQLELYLLGRARVDMTATVDELTIEANENTRVYGYDAEVNYAKIDSEAEARIRLTVTEHLTADASGFSSIRYKGEPTLEIKDKSTSASISKY